VRDPKTLLTWLFAPATDEVPRSHAVGATILRITIGLLWLYNVSWKRAPDFGQEAENGLYKFTKLAVEHPVFPPYSWVVEHLVLPVFQPFGWAVLLAETALAVLLITGTFIRLAALIGIAQSVAIGLSVAYAPGEWPWAYWMMIAAHIVLLLSSSGRMLAVDAVRARLSTGRMVGTVWGVLAILVGLFGIVASFDDPLAARGARLGSTDPSISLGDYNLLGGVVVLAVGVLLLLASRGAARALAMVAAGLAVVAGLSLHVQLGFTDPLLGGNPTSAAFLFAAAVVAFAVSRVPQHEDTRQTVPS
jgi:hypothetical protein